MSAGRLVVIPTETVYGLACDEEAEGAVEKLFAAKNRPVEKQVARLAAGVEQIRAHGGQLDERAEKLAAAFWPGPLTLVLPSPEGFTGYRVPDHPAALALLREFGRPLIATSANLSGQADPHTAAEAVEYLGNSVDMVLDAGRCELQLASTVVKMNPDGWEILREGMLKHVDIQRVI